MPLPSVRLIRNPVLDVFLIELPFPLSREQETLLASRCSSLRLKLFESYLHAEDRQRCLAAGWLIQYVANRILKKDSLEPVPILAESKSSFGRPFLPDFPNLNITVTHSGPIVACSASRHNVGIDIEKVPSLDLMPQGLEFMSFKEEITYRALPSDRKNDFFFDIWTKKEALLKALGVGFQISPNTIDISETTSKWKYYSVKLPNNYRLSICKSKIKTEVSDYEL